MSDRAHPLPRGAGLTVGRRPHRTVQRHRGQLTDHTTHPRRPHVSERLNYASKALTPDLSAAFELALADARDGDLAPVQHVIDGGPVAEGEIFTWEDPAAAPGRVVTEAHAATPDVVGRAVAAARAARKGWRALTGAERVEHLRCSQREFDERKVEIAGVISAETGKSRLEALGEAEEVVDLVKTYADQVEQSPESFATRMNTADPGETNTDLLRPYGAFGVIGPFNFPAALCVNMSAAALLAGNTVVLKPSAKAPRSGALIGEVLAKHVPAGVLNVVQGHAYVGQALAESDVDGIAFTGSAGVGWDLLRNLAAGPYAKPVLAEMGGKNVAVVGRTADLEAAAEGIARSAFGLSGQKCSACSRVVVHSAVHDDLVDRIAARVAEMSLAAPEDPGAFLGPVIDGVAVARFERAAELAKKDGRINAGGARPQGLEGHFVQPTLVTDLPLGHELTREELFLPFVTVTCVDSFQEALDEANATNYGLSAGVFSREQQEIDDFLDQIDAGVVYVNRRSGATTGAWPGIQSFCGWKASGSSGKGGLGPWYLQGFMREQSRTLPVS
ncbi:MAG: aldehyde dehydrogenase family protein [Pseudonocardiaceae bacterium]|nr:aldehyde dehydrogenase family protein [Pseudonocardiaceae bacterium]